MKLMPKNKHSFESDSAQKKKFSIKDFFSKCDEIRSFLRIWPHILNKSFMKNFILCAVQREHWAEMG